MSTNIPGRGIKTYTTSWSEICNNMLSRDDFGGALNRHGMLKELSEMINPNDDPEKKLNTAYKVASKN